MDEDESAPIRQHLETEIARLSAVIGLTGRAVPGFVNFDGAQPFILVGSGMLHYLALERGELVHSQVTRDADELLYWAFEDATSGLAGDWAFKHPQDGEEQRVTRWGRQASLLHALRPEWAERWRAELVDALGPAGDQHLVPALPPPPLVLDPPEPPAREVPLPVPPPRWWEQLLAYLLG